eukprot:4444284-Amphidinium_carterae.3
MAFFLFCLHCSTQAQVVMTTSQTQGRVLKYTVMVSQAFARLELVNVSVHTVHVTPVLATHCILCHIGSSAY